MADSDRVVFKISFADQLRRTQLTKNPLSIEEVHEQISRLFPDVKNYLLYYIDDEGDKITVTTDAELQEAYHVLSPTLRLTLEQHSSSGFVPPTGSLLHVAPSVEPKPDGPVDLNDLQKKLLILKQETESLERLQREENERREKEERERVERELREKEERERKEKEERERLEREERERQEREERERVEKEEREQREKEERERERLEREERERREKEEHERKEREKERREAELRERILKEELQRREKEEREKEEKARKEAELQELLINRQRNAVEQNREKILQSNPQCAEILEKLFSEDVELELAWQALENSSYSNEKRARDLLQMNKLGFDIKVASDALTKFNGNIDAAVDSLME